MPKKEYKESFKSNRRNRDHDDREALSFRRKKTKICRTIGITKVRRKRSPVTAAVEDMVMKFASSSIDSNNSRGRGTNLLQSSRQGNKIGHAPLSESASYKVTIPVGSKFEKDFVISNLASLIAPTTFTPIMHKIVGQDAVFYVDDQKVANKLLNCNRRITMPDGFKIAVRVIPAFPYCEIDSSLREKLKKAMAKRYEENTNALDLSRFHYDPEFVNDYFVGLFKQPMLMQVLNIAAEAIPNLKAINLEKNNLNKIDKLNVLAKKFPNLKILYIGDNKISDIREIDRIKDLNLEELRLAGNPLCNKYRNRNDDYVSDVRKRFPKLLRLDGIELPKPILFDVADEILKFPPSQQIFSVSQQAREIANQFMQTYFMIFDSDSRQPLLDAYHEHACFSLAISAASSSLNKFDHYLTDNRNLFRISDPVRRRKLLKQGRLPVVSYISEMPKTQHYLNSFTMDISLVSETMMLITITGCFKELNTKHQSIRYFDRVLTIVPEGSGFCIMNEQLILTSPTSEQEKALSERALALLNPTISMPSQPGPSALSVAVIPVISTDEPADDKKQQMVMALSQQTNMNIEWSNMCLQMAQWKYDRALAAFNNYFQSGRIPAEAFKK